MARATLFSPQTGQREAIEIGSPRERELFASGYKLESPTQNFQTFQKPTREITRGEGDQLFASEGGVDRPIASPAELPGLIGQGFQDTRRPLAFAGGPPPAPTPSATSAPAPRPAGSAYQSFNDAIQGLLLGIRGGGSADLEAQRNALVRARFTASTTPTPEELRVLTPGQQAALRSGERAGLEEQLGGVQTALSARDKERTNTLQLAGQLLDFTLSSRKLEADERNETIKAIGDLSKTFGDSWLEVVTPEEKKRIEDQLGIEDLSALKGVAASDPNRYQAIGATKYHGNLVFDKVTGKYVGADGQPLSSEQLKRVVETEGPGGAPTQKATSRLANDLAQKYALGAYQQATGSVPAKHAKQDIINQWALAYQNQTERLGQSIEPTTFNPFSAPRTRFVSELEKREEITRDEDEIPFFLNPSP